MTANIRTQFRFQLKDQGVNNVLNTLADNGINLQSHVIIRIRECNIVKITVGPETEDPTVVQETRCILKELGIDFTETSVVEIKYACGIAGQFAIFYTIFNCAKLIPQTVTSSVTGTTVYQFENSEITNAGLARANEALSIMRENPKNPELALVNAGLLCDSDDSSCNDDDNNNYKRKSQKKKSKSRRNRKSYKQSNKLFYKH